MEAIPTQLFQDTSVELVSPSGVSLWCLGDPRLSDRSPLSTRSPLPSLGNRQPQSPSSPHTHPKWLTQCVLHRVICFELYTPFFLSFLTFLQGPRSFWILSSKIEAAGAKEAFSVCVPRSMLLPVLKESRLDNGLVPSTCSNSHLLVSQNPQIAWWICLYFLHD